MARERPHVRLGVSAIDPESSVQDVAPEFWTEPARGTLDYTDWVLKTALERRVTILVPQRAKASIARQAARFAAAGIALHVAADPDTLDLLDDKSAFSASLVGDPYLCPTIPIENAAEFERAVEELTAGGVTACVKPARGVYGAGYWTLDGPGNFAHLADPDARRITPAAYAAALRAAEDDGERFSLLVMEHLPGLEASVDVVAERGRSLLVAVRTKLDANRQRIETRHPLVAHASGLIERYALHGAINIQYRLDRHGAWRILEINARAAGGASYCDAVEVPFSVTWLDVVTGTARPFETAIDAEIIAVVDAVPRASAAQNGSAGTSQA